MSDVSIVNNAMGGAFSTSANVTQLPCDRGVANGPRGLHRFQLSPGAERPICVFCGSAGPKVDYSA